MGALSGCVETWWKWWLGRTSPASCHPFKATVTLMYIWLVNCKCIDKHWASHPPCPCAYHERRYWWQLVMSEGHGRLDVELWTCTSNATLQMSPLPAWGDIWHYRLLQWYVTCLSAIKRDGLQVDNDGIAPGTKLWASSMKDHCFIDARWHTFSSLTLISATLFVNKHY